MLWTAFILGLFGSLHCVGMCGPIALALPLDRSSKWSTATGAFSYNIGRVLTYATGGLILGGIGQAAFAIGIQRWVSLAAGVIILFYVIWVYALKKSFNFSPFNIPGASRLKLSIQELFGRKSYTSLLSIGLLNGLLPCGLVYFALVGAVNSSSAVSGAAYMALFGLGTMPIMMATNLVGSRMQGFFKMKLNRAIPYVLTVFGLLFILRGLALGIPLLSPAVGGVAGSCCQ